MSSALAEKTGDAITLLIEVKRNQKLRNCHVADAALCVFVISPWWNAYVVRNNNRLFSVVLAHSLI